jgi:hypothetical protein
MELEAYPPPDKRSRPDVPLVAFTAAEGKRAATPTDQLIKDTIALVSQNNLSQWVHDLSAFHTRHTRSIYIDQVATWLANQFKVFGYTDILLHQYSQNGYQLKNVICTKQGTSNINQIMMLCSHYDCCMEQLNDANSRAPGADDNATGIAVILELARILSHIDLKNTIQFVAFSGEEQGYWGSTAYADYIKSNHINLHRLINLDMVGYPPPNLAITVEQDTGNVVSANNQPSQEFAKVMAQMATDYTHLPVALGEIYGSDYMPFEARGYVVIGVYDDGNNPNYHRSSDTPDTVNYAYMADVARIALATILHETVAWISVRDIVARCLGKLPPLSVREDILGNNHQSSLRKRLEEILQICS